MKLRTQLAALSLSTLILPWVVFQYFLVFDELLRNEKNTALAASANAIAARLGSEPALFTLKNHTTEQAQLYAHSLPSAPVLDGFNDDWVTYGIEPQQFSDNASLNTKVSAGIFKQTLSLFFKVTDPSIYYHTPGSKSLATGDHLIIATSSSKLEHRYFIINTEGPGSISANYRDNLGHIKTDYRIKGFWRETNTGYQVELQLPIALLPNAFAFAVVDASPVITSRAIGTMNEIALIAGGRDPGVLPAITGELVTINNRLQKALSAFNQNNFQLHVIDKNQWIIAKTGELDEDKYQAKNFWLWETLLSFVHNKRHLPKYTATHNGKNLTASVKKALTGHSSHTWYSDKNTEIGTFSMPIYLDKQKTNAIETQHAGVLLIETRRNPWQLLQGQTFLYLLAITIASGLALSLLLIGYASWLSFRIKRLGLAATVAQKSQHLLNQSLDNWPRARVNDELSDLSDRYYQLLQRVNGYTSYLKTLSSKLSHELRTPLAVIRSSLDNLNNTNLTPEAKKYSARAQEGGERLSSILTAMTEATRVETSIQHAEKEYVDLQQLIQDMLHAYEDIYPQHNFTLKITKDKPLAYKSFIAPELFVQMLDKLIDNATDFSPTDSPIEVRLQRFNTAEPYFQLVIQNIGPTLPQHLEGKLFDSLTSARPKNTVGDNKIHLGLGLQVVALIVAFHHGKAEIASTLDKTGVTVTVTLPVQEPAIRAKRL